MRPQFAFVWEKVDAIEWVMERAFTQKFMERGSASIKFPGGAMCRELPKKKTPSVKWKLFDYPCRVEA